MLLGDVGVSSMTLVWMPRLQRLQRTVIGPHVWVGHDMLPPTQETFHLNLCLAMCGGS